MRDARSFKEDLKVSIIIPARNEEKNLTTLFRSLENQSYRPYEIIVSNDSSEDNTEKVAKGFGAKVINITDRPEGWLGKPFACYTGALQAKGDVFLFLDADTFFEKDGLENILKCFQSYGGVISVQPFHKIKRFYENFAAYFNLILMGSMNHATPLQHKLKPIGAFGPCMVVSREDYFKIDGHKTAKGDILEDLAIGKKFIKTKTPLYGFGGKKTLNFRMYPEGIKDLFYGFAKGFSTGAKNTAVLNFIMIILWISGSIHPITYTIANLRDFNLIGIYLGAALYVLFVAQIFWILRKIGNFSILTAIIYPFFLIFFFIVFFYSVIMTIFNKRVRWKGRKVDLNSKG